MSNILYPSMYTARYYSVTKLTFQHNAGHRHIVRLDIIVRQTVKV